MNRHFLAGAVILTCSCLIVGVVYACVSLDVDSDYKVYTPVGVTASIDAWVYEGGPVDDWDWSWPTGVSGFYSSDSSDSSTSYGAYSSAGVYSIDVSADGPNGWDNATSSLYVVEVDKLQYWDGVASQWVDITGTLYVKKSDSVQFKAVRSPSSASQWPSGKPVWGGTAGASGIGTTKTVTFNTLSSSTSDDKTVSAECGNTVSANVIVFDFEGTLSPDDPFTGRSLDDYGIAETVKLDCTISPAGLTASQLGGLLWSEGLGKGSVTSATSDGTANYDAGAYSGTANLYLSVVSGPSNFLFENYVKTIVEPSGGSCSRKTGSNIAHIKNILSVGVLTDFYITPTNVSFCNVEFTEGSATTYGSGMLENLADHNAWGTWYDIIGDGENKVDLPTLMDSAEMVTTSITQVSQYWGGTAYVDIPWKYRVGAFEWTFTTVRQEYRTFTGGNHGVKKDGEGWHDVNHTDDTASYY